MNDLWALWLAWFAWVGMGTGAAVMVLLLAKGLD